MLEQVEETEKIVDDARCTRSRMRILSIRKSDSVEGQEPSYLDATLVNPRSEMI